jgi:zinc D-Ala-D-Ala carboxypeptidase
LNHEGARARPALAPELEALHRALGIPADYAAQRALTPYVEAAESELVHVAINPDGRAVRLLPAAAEAWQAMRTAAVASGIELVAISGFRSVARQTEIIREKLAAGHNIADILRSVAAPGFSEHHTGRAIDIGSPEHIELDEDFERTAAFRWLQRHAGEFGFTLSYPRNNAHGIVYEPWHWCWHR